MLTRLLACVCCSPLRSSRPAAPQTSPDMQKVLDRLDKLEDENQQAAG